MKYTTKDGNPVENLDPRYNFFHIKASLRSQLELNHIIKNNEYYNNIVATPEVKWLLDYGMGARIVASSLLSIVISFMVYLFTLSYILPSLIISFICVYVLLYSKRIYENYKYDKKNSITFNDSELKENDNWIKKDKNGDRWIIWEEYDRKLDHRQLKIDDVIYDKIKKYWYEIDNGLSYDISFYVDDTLYFQANKTLYSDLKIDNAIHIKLYNY